MRFAYSIILLLAACGGAAEDAAAPDATAPSSDAASATPQLVQVVLFKHIEDTTPGGTLGTDQCKTSYLAWRPRLVEMAQRAASHGLTWVLQPDWKFLEAALLYEDATVTADTNGKNLLRYLHEDLGVPIDPHSHESNGYNYTDVAYLLEQLGVGGSTVIGGHIWDPSLVQFQAWDRYREPVAGEKYPSYTWRGDILIGAGTPNHTDDPILSGVWRPQDRDHFFDDDPSGNIVAVGAWQDDVAGVDQLVALHDDGTVPADVMLTASWNLEPSSISTSAGIDQVESTELVPIADLRDQGKVVVTDFTTLVADWQAAGASAYLYQP